MIELTDGQRSALKSFILYLFTFIVICFYGVTHALAYDFTNWTGAVVNKFVFKLSNDEYITHTSNDPFIWLFRPDVGATENFAIKSVGGELGGFTKEVTGSTIFQFALGYTTINLDENTTPCQWFKDFSNYTLEYSTNNGNSWADFNVSTLSCAQNDGFIVLSYSVTSPGTVNITNLSFNGKGNEARSNAISTIFTAFNSYPVDSSSNVIINQNNEIIYQNQELIDTQNKTNEKLDGVIDNQKENTDKIIESNKETQDVIKDQFNNCRDSINLADFSKFKIGYVHANGSLVTVANTGEMASDFIKVKPNTTYTFTIFETSDTYDSWFGVGEYTTNIVMSSDYFIERDTNYNITSKSITFTTSNDTNYVVLSARNLTGATKVQLEEGSSSTSYEEYGKKVCTNKLDEANETSKGILGKIKDILSYVNPFSENFFAYKLIELLIDGLKSLFIPDEDFFTTWWNDFKEYVDNKLGFLTIPFEIFIDFINLYLNLSEDNIVINIPDVTVPNFEDHVIIHSQSFNWSELLSSKTALYTLWQLYLDFIDVYLILNFINLCSVTYSRIFGGDTNIYEYYTVDDSYYFDAETGQRTDVGKHSERKTVRKRVSS